MRKRMLAFLLSLAMTVTMTPAIAFAEDVAAVEGNETAVEENTGSYEEPVIPAENEEVQIPEEEQEAEAVIEEEPAPAAEEEDVLTEKETEAAKTMLAEAPETAVASEAQLDAVLNKCQPAVIKITADFNITKEHFVAAPTTIYTTEKHTLTRDAHFLGDMFIIGEDRDGNNMKLKGVNVVFELGNPDKSTPTYEDEDLLIIDGNRDNIDKRKLKVKGTVLFNCHTATTCMYNNATIQNCKKLDNERTKTIDEYGNNWYTCSYPNRIGGAAVIISSGGLDIYGGNIRNCACAEELDTDTDPNDPHYRDATQGGVIYNFGNIHIYGGTFEDNWGARGGIFYNYKMMKIYAGTFRNNYAQKYGGMVYLPLSQYSNIIWGGSEEEAAKCKDGECNIVVDGNTALNTGGAIFSQNKTGLVFYEDCNTVFRNNKTIRFNGGAISCTGPMIVKGGVTFENNDANSKAGAIYLANNKTDLVTRKSTIRNVVFKGNTAARGGAVALMAKAADYDHGGIAAFIDCTFEGNRAVAGKHACDTTTYQFNEEEDINTNGGAIYISRKSTMDIKNCTFKENVAELKEGGAVYVTAQSKVTFDGNKFIGNEVPDPAEGCGASVALHGIATAFNDCLFDGNKAARHAGGIYVSYKNITDDFQLHSNITVNNCEFNNNRSNYHGGGIYMTSKQLQDAGCHEENCAHLKVVNSSFDNNYAYHNGGAIYATKSQMYLNDNEFTNNNVDAAVSDSTGSRYGGGALYATNSNVDVNVAEMKGNVSDYNGGAMAFYSTSKVKLNKIHADENSTNNTQGGAMYINKTVCDVYDSLFENNSAGSGAGAISVYSNAVIHMFDTTLKNNRCKTNGGAMVFSLSTSKPENVAGRGYLHNVKIIDNVAQGTTNYGGGGIWSKASDIEFNGGEISGNEAQNNGYGGGIALYTNTRLEMNDVLVKDNHAVYRGGGIYTSGGDIDLYSCTFEGNRSFDYGGAIAVPSNPAQLNINNCVFDGNYTEDTYKNGGAIWLYSIGHSDVVGDAKAVFNTCTFKNNYSGQYGGCASLQNGTHAEFYNSTVEDNEAGSYGGFLYASSEGTSAKINGISVKGNTAIKGQVAYSAENPTIELDKSHVTDAEEEVTGDYFKAPKWDIKNLVEISEDIPECPVYEQRGENTTYTAPPEKEDDPEVTVKGDVDKEIFALAEGTPDNSVINASYGNLKKLSNTNNFQGRDTTTFKNINGKTVTTESYVVYASDATNNTLVGIGLMIYQAMDYKRAHPNEEVTIDVSTFRWAISSAVNINRKSRYFGYMRNLTGQEYDRYGFVRISYLLLSAARMGIKVNAVGQIDGYPISAADDRLGDYFVERMNLECDPDYVKETGKTVADFMNWYECEWTSYENLPAADMMHTKICAVNHYRDKDGKDHGCSLWFGSGNIDGISSRGYNGKNALQTAIVINNHDELYRVATNYLHLLYNYCDQEGIKDFREVMNQRNTQQIRDLEAGKTVAADKQVVYLGTANDKVFELYFTPLGGKVGDWDEINDPYCKYLRKLRNSTDYIWFAWNNPKYVTSSFEMSRMMQTMVNDSFVYNKNKNNRFFVYIPANKANAPFNADGVMSLTPGKDIKYASNDVSFKGANHAKDMFMSYKEKGKDRVYVSLLNSLNLHQGAFFYQSNHIVVVKETNGNKPGSVFYSIVGNSTDGIVKTDLARRKISLARSSYAYNGKVKKPAVKINYDVNDLAVTYAAGRKNVGKYKVTVNGKTGTNVVGSKTMYFKIVPKGTSLRKLVKGKKVITVKWNKQAKKMSRTRINGYQIQYSTSSTFSKNVKIAKVKGYAMVSKKLTNLKAKTNYYVRIRTYKTVNGVTYYSSWSAKKNIKTR